jgi:hypothetical protein
MHSYTEYVCVRLVKIPTTRGRPPILLGKTKTTPARSVLKSRKEAARTIPTLSTGSGKNVEGSESPAVSEVAGAAYFELAKEQVEEQRDRKQSLEQRGSFIIMSSGAIVSLLFGLAAVVVSQEKFELPVAARGLLIGSVALFLVAGFCGLRANRLLDYERVEPSELRRLVSPALWPKPIVPAARRTAEVRVKMLATAQEQDDKKAKSVRRGLKAEVAALVLVTAAVCDLLVQG